MLLQECSQILHCSLTQYTEFICLQQLGKCHFNMSDGDTHTLSSVCIHTDLNATSQESVALQMLKEVKLFNVSQECAEGFKSWICRHPFSLCRSYGSNNTSEECEIFQSLCADKASLPMTCSLLRSVCFVSDTSENGKCIIIVIKCICNDDLA